MKNVFKIFFRDIKRISKNPIAIITVFGVCFIPALYAWFNIVANWDPYGNTNGIKVAVANVDEGYKKGEIGINIGDEVVDNLKKNDLIGWQFVSEEKALEGVKSGDYYAGIIIPKDFSKNLASILDGKIIHPKFKYYTNQKKNAIAPKITDKGANTIQQQLNETFIKTISETSDKLIKIAKNNNIFDKKNTIFDKIQETLTNTSGTLDIYENTMNALKLTLDSTKLTLSLADFDKHKEYTKNDINVAIDSIHNFSNLINSNIENSFDKSKKTMDTIYDNLKEIDSQVDTMNDRILYELKNAKESIDRIQENNYQNIENLRKFNKIIKNNPSDTTENLDLIYIRLENLNSHIENLQKTCENIIASIEKTGTISKENINKLNSQLNKVKKIITIIEIKNVKHPALILVLKTLKDGITNIQNILTNLQENISNGSISKEAFTNLLSLLKNLSKDNEKFIEIYQKDIRPIIKNLEDKGNLIDFEKMALKIEDLNETLSDIWIICSDSIKIIENTGKLTDFSLDKFKEKIDESDEKIIDIKNTYNNEVKPQINKIEEDNKKVLKDISNLTTDIRTHLDEKINQVNKVIDKNVEAIISGNKALNSTNNMLKNAKKNINDFKEEVDKIENKFKSEKITNVLENSPELFAQFMATPVEIENIALYNIENYGSAMTPFYSTLAIWVGGIVLVAILKVKVDEDNNIKNLKPYESYFGRYILFMILGFIQALIICLGDLYFLKIQCLNPALFIISGLLISFIFTSIIYTLTVSFGDIGKALSVFLLVIQVAGSGGTFPIEVTPKFFQNVYPLLPFTYGINAMRETIGGLYKNLFINDLKALLLFIIPVLILGVILRVPLIKFNEFFEERLEETHLM